MDKVIVLLSLKLLQCRKAMGGTSFLKNISNNKSLVIVWTYILVGFQIDQAQTFCVCITDLLWTWNWNKINNLEGICDINKIELFYTCKLKTWHKNDFIQVTIFLL